MSYKNSVKLLGSNFVLVWKQLAFTLIVTIISWLLALAFAASTINLLSAQGWFSKANDLIEVVYTTPAALNATIKELIASFFSIISANFASHFISYVGFIIAAFVLPMFMFGIGQFNLCVLANTSMSSFVKIGYTSSLLNSFKDAARYSLFKMLVTIIFGLVGVGVFMLYLKLAKGVLVTLLMLVLFVIIMVALFSLKLTLLSYIAPKMIEENMRIKHCLKEFFKTGSNAFWRTFSNSIIVVLTIVAGNAFFGIFTLFAGLTLTIPASMVLVSIFMVTNYYTLSGKKYYLSANLIVEPSAVKEKEPTKGKFGKF